MLTEEIAAFAAQLGFDLVGVIPAGPPRRAAEFAGWLAAGHHGEMAYLADRAAERLDPARWAPAARSVVVLGVNYNEPSKQDHSARIARYARLPDYHDLIKPRLYALDAFIRERTGRSELGKVFVDAAPVLERDFAEQAGLGFIGRNCCLITPGLGSWTVLAGLMVPEMLTMDDRSWTIDERRMVHGPSSIVHGCGQCMRCLDACPTRAFVAPYVLDARRCISYLTIELRGPIPRDLRPLMGDWVFGCDVCQEVCPYNRQASASQAGHAELHIPSWRDVLQQETHVMLNGYATQHASRQIVSEASFTPFRTSSRSSTRLFADDMSLSTLGHQPAQSDSRKFRNSGSAAQLSMRQIASDREASLWKESATLSELLTLDEAGLRARFRGTPVMRAKRRGLVRNACVAAGNSGDTALVPLLGALLTDPEPLVRGHAAWALGRIGGAEAERALTHALAGEVDPWVRSELVARPQSSPQA